MTIGRGSDAGRRFEATKARAEEWQKRRMAADGEQVTSEARARAGWVVAAIAIALFAGAAYLELGPIVAVATIAVLVVLILFVRRMFR